MVLEFNSQCYNLFRSHKNRKCCKVQFKITEDDNYFQMSSCFVHFLTDVLSLKTYDTGAQQYYSTPTYQQGAAVWTGFSRLRERLPFGVKVNGASTTVLSQRTCNSSTITQTKRQWNHFLAVNCNAIRLIMLIIISWWGFLINRDMNILRMASGSTAGTGQSLNPLYGPDTLQADKH